MLRIENLDNFDSFKSMAEKRNRVCLGKRIINVWKWFYEFNSFAGITQIRTTDTKISKFVWLILFVLALGLTSFLVFQSLETYLKHETVTTINVRSEPKIDFPSVTICNQNRIHCRHLYNLIQNCTKVRRKRFKLRHKRNI